MAELLISFALKEGRVVHVDAVDRGRACRCICPACEGPLVARKGNIRVHHFAHDADTACDGESALHATARLLLFQRIQDALQEQRDIPLFWQCLICPDECRHDGNLLKRAVNAAMELTISDADIRPDILLTGIDGIPTALLEIVHTHAPEKSVIRYAKDNNLPLLEFHVNAGDDLHQFSEGALTPQTARMPGCPCRTCGNCGERVCDSDKHHHCLHCNKIYDSSYGPNDGHYFCEKCQKCVDAPSDFSIFHWHCRDCGVACNGTRDRYVRCFCCYNERKFGVKCNVRDKPDHRHCWGCGRVFNDRGIYEFCYRCHQGKLAKDMWERDEAWQEQEKVQQERERQREIERERERQGWAALQRDLDMSIAHRQRRMGP